MNTQDDARQVQNAIYRNRPPVLDLLNSANSTDFLASMAFWSDAQPITSGLLGRLGIGKLAAHLGVSREYARHVKQRYCSPWIDRREPSPDRDPTVA